MGDKVGDALTGEGRKADLRVVGEDGAPVIRIDADLNRTAREFGEVVRKLDLFIVNGELRFFDHEGAQQEMTPSKFRTWINQHVLVCRRFDKESGDALPDTLDVQEAKAVLEAEVFRRAVRPVGRINRVRLPVIRDGELRWLDWGYDAQERTYTVPGGLEYELDVPLEVAKGWFERYFGSFPYYDDRSKAVQLAAMLALYVRHLMPPGCLRKGFLWRANKSDSGKSIAAKGALYPVMGNAAAAKMKRAEDFDKELEGFLRSAVSYIFYDNVYGGVANASLDQLITSKELTFRAMGGHGVVRVKFDGVLLVTGNDTEMNADAARRFLLVDFFADDDPAERVVKAPLDDNLMESDEWRKEALGALCALVANWFARKCPAGPTVDRTFRAFTQVLGGVVTAAGYPDPIAPPADEAALNPDEADWHVLLETLCQDMDAAQESERACTLEHLARLAREADIFVGLVGNQEQGRKLTIKEGKLKADEAACAVDEGILTPSQRGKWNEFLRAKVGQKPKVGDRTVQFGLRPQRRKTTYTISVS